MKRRVNKQYNANWEWFIFWIFYNVPELEGFQTMVILDPYGMPFDAVGVFGLAFHLS